MNFYFFFFFVLKEEGGLRFGAISKTFEKTHEEEDHFFNFILFIYTFPRCVLGGVVWCGVWQAEK